MKIKRVAYFALGASVFAASCTKEAAEPDVYDWVDGDIYFKTAVAEIGKSRGRDMTLDALESFQVTCFNLGNNRPYIPVPGSSKPYFEDATFVRQEAATGLTFVSAPGEQYEWPEKAGDFTFIAFSPSRGAMASGNPAANGDNYYKLTNLSKENGSSIDIDYRLGKIRVKPDIADQFDFVTACVSGNRSMDFAAGVQLSFRHQMCQVELQAWGASEDFDFEIAGVRIGNPVVEGDFIFADASDKDGAGRWAQDDNPVMEKVEYTYRSADNTGAADKYAEGDRIFRIGGNEHRSQESAATIMGRGGCAMVLPTANRHWEGTDDPKISADKYSTDRMYFSILLRVSNSKSGSVAYPYRGNPYGMKVVYYAVDQEGNIIQSLYKRETDGKYFTDKQLKNRYNAPQGVTVKEFGWAAIPVDTDWKAGKRYVYTLDYTEGIGLHDPEDPEPGKPIVGQKPIKMSVSVSEWEYAEKDENYDPDVDVPN